MVDRSRAQFAGYAVAAVLLVVALVKLGLIGHGSAAVAPAPVRLEHGSTGGAGSGGIYVHVAGAVRRPGLYRLSSAARVAMAIRRAGGGTGKARLDGVNLAARVQDGQQVVVPGAGPGPGGGGAGGAGGKPSLGNATVEQLDGLDGIGPTLAKRIVEYRKSHGGFRSIDDLREVEGIGEKRLAALREAVNP